MKPGERAKRLMAHQISGASKSGPSVIKQADSVSKTSVTVGKTATSDRPRFSHPALTKLPQGWRLTAGPSDEKLFNRSLYRFFDVEQHADDLARGRVWISTLQTCRTTEDKARRDDGEASSVLYLDHFEVQPGQENDPATLEILRHAQIDVGPGVVVKHHFAVQRLPDAFIVCFTSRHDPQAMKKMGRFCVRVDDPLLLFKRVTQRLLASGAAITGCAMGPIQYRDRHFTASEPAPEPIGFVKPKVPFEEEQETRMLWRIAEGVAIRPHLLYVPSASSLCERIS